MGTRRSRHNKGRKPFYKDFRSIAAHLIAHPMWGRYWTGTNWKPEDEFKLSVLCEADADIEASADSIGRKPSTIAHRARDTGLTLPRQWAQLIAPKPVKKAVTFVTDGVIPYPYIRKANDSHADILAINALVPKGMPENVRADVCQEIILAILEGRTTMEKLRARKGSASYFIRRFYKENYEQGGNAIAFELEDSRSYDEVASSIAANEWHREELIEKHRHIRAFRPFVSPNQIDAVWRDQVGRYRLSMNEIGNFLSQEEAEELLEAA